jgi:hypothetical protein
MAVFSWPVILSQTENNFLGPAHLGEFTRLSTGLQEDDRLMGLEDVVADRRVR